MLLKPLPGLTLGKLIHVLILLCLLPGFSVSQNADINLLRAINKHESPTATKNFKLLSATVTPVSITTPVSMFTISLINKDRVLQRNSYLTGASVAISSLVSAGFKYSINRKRPFDTYPFIIKKSNVHTASLPSGHTTSAFATATALSLSYPKWYVIVPSYAWTATVAYSRMYLGMHYPSDVLGGMIIGIGIPFLIWEGEKWLMKKME